MKSMWIMLGINWNSLVVQIYRRRCSICLRTVQKTVIWIESKSSILSKTLLKAMIRISLKTLVKYWMKKSFSESSSFLVFMPKMLFIIIGLKYLLISSFSQKHKGVKTKWIFRIMPKYLILFWKTFSITLFVSTFNNHLLNYRNILLKICLRKSLINRKLIKIIRDS